MVNDMNEIIRQSDDEIKEELIEAGIINKDCSPIHDYRDFEFSDGSLPRQCKHCNTWSKYDRPNDKKQRCFTVICPLCHKEFEIVIGMKGGRQ